MSTTPPEGIHPTQESHNGPGALLAQARNDLRLSQEEVAGRLHLATHQIRSLEADDYSGMSSATYVRGYLRSYALLLGLDPETVLKAYSRRIAKPVVQDFSTIAPQKQITSHHHQIRFVTYVVAIMVIGLAIAWWQSRDTRLPTPLPPVQVGNTEPPAPAVENDGQPAAAPPSTAPTPVVATKPVESPPPVVPAPAASVAPAPVPAPVPAIPANALRVRFVLHADQDAWVDIRDARQNKLLYETVSAGRSIPLEGVAPVSIFLGNAAATRIEMNGEAVDIERHRRGVFARFTLGETTAAPLH